MAAITPMETVMHSTLTKSRGKLILASVKSNALQAWAFATDRVEYEDGGKDITNPITLGRNPNIATYSYYAALPVAQTNEFASVSYGWSRAGGTVIISDQEEDENQGEAQIFKLMKAKIDVLEESFQENFSIYMYGAGAGDDPNGLANLIPDDPTTGTLGGINRATETQWRTSAYNFAGTLNSTNIEEAFDDILLDLKTKGSRPDIIIAGRNIIRYYRQAVRAKMSVVIQFSDTRNGQRMMDLGFGGIYHQDIPIVFDEDCPVDKCYFINSTYLRLHILRHANMKLKQLTAPWNMDAKGRRIIWQGQWCMWKAFRTHGVVYN